MMLERQLLQKDSNAASLYQQFQLQPGRYVNLYINDIIIITIIINIIINIIIFIIIYSRHNMSITFTLDTVITTQDMIH